MTIHTSIHADVTRPHVLDRLSADIEARAFRARQVRTFIPVSFDFAGLSGESPGLRVVSTREDFSPDFSDPRSRPPHYETVNQRWASVLARMIKARTVMCIERNSAHENALLAREFTFSVTQPNGTETEFPALLLGGHEHSPDKLVGLDHILSEMKELLQSPASLPNVSYDNTSNAISRAQVHGMLPIPGPSAGWAFFHTWMLLFMTREEYYRPRQTSHQRGHLRSVDDVANISCCTMVNSWMDKSATWAAEQPGRLEGIIRARSGHAS